MSKQTEKIFKELDKFMAQYNSSVFEEITEANAKSSDDFLELAYDATSKKNALKYAKKAFELDPNNLEQKL